MRYPGGNFLSGYNWEDGVGPKEQRPRDSTWRGARPRPTSSAPTSSSPGAGRRTSSRCWPSIWARADRTKRATWSSTAIIPAGTYYSDLRRAHGYEQPHDIRFWCLGNEMDGPWQICRKTAQEYGRIAQETGKVMRWVDGNLQLAACGSSQRAMPTYAAWEYEVLDHCFNEVDFISLHAYFRNDSNDIDEYFTVIEDLDCFITRSGRDLRCRGGEAPLAASASCCRSTNGTSGTRRTRPRICASPAGRRRRR